MTMMAPEPPDANEPQPRPRTTLAPALSVEYDNISIVYNKFLSAISYKPAIIEVADENSCQCLHSPSYILADQLPAGFCAYKMEDDFTQNLAEFSLANAIYSGGHPQSRSHSIMINPPSQMTTTDDD